ncbi:MAG: class I SAM-dependent methyltransferase [Planctomycetota bacterium]|nr:class I SAM-dependent methyltransferase [Planctomycetota bacterium]
MSDSQQKTIETYQKLVNASALMQTFAIGRRLGVFYLLVQGQKSVSEMANALGLVERPLELFLDQLVETGYIERYGEDYAISVLGKMLPDELADLGDRYYSRMESWLRTGDRIEDPETPFDDSDFGREKRAFEWMTTPNALEMLQILNIGQSRKGMKVVELSCGSAVMSSAFGYHDPEMKVCLVDNSENLARARETAESIGIAERCQFIEADPTVVDFQFKADLIVLSCQLCRFDDVALKSLLKNAAGQLQKSGEIVIVDEFSETPEARFSNRNAALLTEFRSPLGRQRDRKQVTDLLYACGFVDALYSDLRSAPGTRGVLVAGVSKV